MLEVRDDEDSSVDEKETEQGTQIDELESNNDLDKDSSSIFNERITKNKHVEELDEVLSLYKS